MTYVQRAQEDLPSYAEISNILEIVVEQLKKGKTESVILDSNGNTIGAWSWE